MTEPAPSPNSPLPFALPWKWHPKSQAIYSADDRIVLSVRAEVTCPRSEDDFYACRIVEAKAHLHLKDDHAEMMLAAVNAHAALTAERDEARERAVEATIAREEWRTVAKRAGICMTCAQMAPEPYGCTDCLNTGWDGGAPVGFVAESTRDAALAEVARLEQVGQFLWSLLDDIDTASDMAKGDDAGYRELVEKIQRRRFEVGSTDGYTVKFTSKETA